MRRSINCSLTALVWLTSLAHAQTLNPLGWYDANERCFDAWGYVAPNGDEFAIMLTATATLIVECTDPEQPALRGRIGGAIASRRDARVFGTLCYSVSDAAPGMQVIDLANPRSPSLLGTAGTRDFAAAHTLAVDAAAGRLYVAVVGSSLAVYDVATNPAAPALLGYYAGPELTDFQVNAGLGFGANPTDGRVHTVDVSGWPLVAVNDSINTIADPTSVSPFASNGFAAICERDPLSATRGSIRIVDLTDPAFPTSVGREGAPIGEIYMNGDVCHVAGRNEGYQRFDFSDPTQGSRLGLFLPCRAPTSFTQTPVGGVVGCYPFQPSGNVYVVDQDTGLYIVNASPFVRLRDPARITMNTATPYSIVATVTSTSSTPTVTLEWTIDGQSFTNTPMQAASSLELVGTIPPQPAGTEILYRVRASDSSGTTLEPRFGGMNRLIVGALDRLYFDDFEGSAIGWSVNPSGQSDWQRGAPRGRHGAGWSDPPKAFSGLNCWGNDLGLCGMDGEHGTTSVFVWNLTSPSIETHGLQGLQLRYRRWLTISSGGLASIQVNGQAVYSNTTSVVDRSWTEQVIDISAISDTAPIIRVNFLFFSGFPRLGGWNIDDVEIVSTEPCAVRTYGPPTAGTNGPPEISFAGPARPGDTFSIGGDNMLPGAAAALLFGPTSTSFEVLGIRFLVDLLNATTLPTTATATGTATLQFSVPNDPLLIGNQLSSQWLVADPGGAAGLVATSHGLRFQICP